MGIISLWQIIFKYVFFFTTFSFMVMSIVEEASKDKKETCVTSKQKDENRLYDIIQFIILIIATVVLIIGCVYIAINQELLWLLIIVVAAEVLDKIAGAFVSVGIIGNVVKENTKGTLSFRENIAVFSISLVVMFLQMANCFNKCLDYVSKCFGSITSDLLVLLLYIITLYLYIFLTCALVAILISFVTKLVKKIYNYIPRKGKIKKIGDFFAERTNKSVKQSKLTISLIKWFSERSVFIRIICIPMLVITVALDIVAFFLFLMFSIVISAVGYIVIIYRLVGNVIKKMVCYFVEISSKKIVAVSFRVAIIAALVITVITNRYDAFVEEIDNSTAVLEFVASSIVIPVVFEWINSNWNKVKA